jgi:sodium/hydrogen antiporter
MVDIYIIDLFVIGLLLLMVTLGSGWISRLPLSFALIYLVVGIFLGPYGFGIVQLRTSGTFNAEFLERISELVVIISVFSYERDVAIANPRGKPTNATVDEFE